MTLSTALLLIYAAGTFHTFGAARKTNLFWSFLGAVIWPVTWFVVLNDMRKARKT